MNRKNVGDRNEGSAEPDEDEDRARASATRPIDPERSASAAKAAVVNARHKAEETAKAAVLEDIWAVVNRAKAVDNDDAAFAARLAVLATHRGDHAAAARQMAEARELLRPKPVVSDDQREVLIRTIVGLGAEACAEVARRDKARARRK